MSKTALYTGLSLCVAGNLLFGQIACGDDYRTPLAGEAFHTELFGEKVDVEPRDRRHLTAASFGVQWIPNGPTLLEILPFGSLYVWHNWDDEGRRFRGTFAGVVNDLNFNIGSKSMNGWEIVLTFDNFVIPFGRSEYVEGQRIQDVEVEWSYLYAGFGLGYRKQLFPGHQDNTLEMSLTYEPGFLFFKGSKDASRRFIVPSDTYEGRVHFRLRADALERNLMELLHRGYAFGGDVLYGRRENWQNWGGVAFDPPDFRKEKDYVAASAFAIAAGGVPFVNSERHRLISSIYGGIGKDLDRFSAFRLPGRPTGYEWEALSLPIIPGVAFNELFPSKYGIANLEYRYEALFFLYPYLRGTWSVVDRPRFQPEGRIKNQVDTLPALGSGVVSGAPWDSQIELNYSYNFGIFRDRGGKPTMGGHGFFAFWSKQL
ncbi:MAG: hypothetical protein ACT4OO_01695 [Nitrospiraceae bacterium]